MRTLSIILLTLAATAATTDGSTAQTVPYAFAGSVVITDRAGPDCDAVNVQVGELHTSVYRPVQTAVSTASLHLLQDQVAVRLVPSGGGDFAGAGQYSAQMFTARGGFVQFTGNYAALRVRPIPTPTTPVIDISGKITNFKDGGRCTITFAGGYVLRPGS